MVKGQAFRARRCVALRYDSESSTPTNSLNNDQPSSRQTVHHRLSPQPLPHDTVSHLSLPALPVTFISVSYLVLLFGERTLQLPPRYLRQDALASFNCDQEQQPFSVTLLRATGNVNRRQCGIYKGGRSYCLGGTPLS